MVHVVVLVHNQTVKFNHLKSYFFINLNLESLPLTKDERQIIHKLIKSSGTVSKSSIFFLINNDG